jgi:hypothetical protein
MSVTAVSAVSEVRALRSYTVPDYRWGRGLHCSTWQVESVKDYLMAAVNYVVYESVVDRRRKLV